MIVLAMIIVKSVQVGNCLIVVKCNCRVMPLTFYQFVNQLWHCKRAWTSNLKLAHFFVVTREFSICIATLLQLFKIGLQLRRVWQSP